MDSENAAIRRLVLEKGVQLSPTEGVQLPAKTVQSDFTTEPESMATVRVSPAKGNGKDRLWVAWPEETAGGTNLMGEFGWLDLGEGNGDGAGKHCCPWLLDLGLSAVVADHDKNT